MVEHEPDEVFADAELQAVNTRFIGIDGRFATLDGRLVNTVILAVRPRWPSVCPVPAPTRLRW
jgi:hypothetical protein